MTKIIVITGADGSGKSTLSSAIAKATNGYVLHSTYNKNWSMEKYHTILMETAIQLRDIGITVILDRWSCDEHVYGNVFRDGESYDTQKLIDKYNHNLVWVYCHNNEIVLNHLKNKEKRYEMFDDMSEIVKEFEHYVNNYQYLDWQKYNYYEQTTEDFLKQIGVIK